MAADQKYKRTEYTDGSVVLSNLRNKKGIPIFSLNDSYTATKVTTWYDGSTMDDSKADGKIYLKLKDTGEYFKVNLPNNKELFLEKDTMAQMRALSSTDILLLKMGYYKGVRLNGYYTEGDTPTPIEYYLSDTTESDDGGSVIDVGGVKLETKISIGNLYIWGVIPNNMDVSDNFQKAVDYAIKNKLGSLILTNGIFNIDKQIVFNEGGVDIIGQGTLKREESWSDRGQEFGTILKIKDGIQGAFKFSKNVKDGFTIKGIGFHKKGNRTVGNSVAIYFNSEWNGPTWPVVIKECQFRGFNTAFYVQNDSQQYIIAFLQFNNNSFSQNDYCVKFGYSNTVGENLGSRNLTWGFTFSHNYCHDNSTILDILVSYDTANIFNNNLEGNIVFSDGTIPEYALNIEVYGCRVCVKDNHFESAMSSFCRISALLKDSNGNYYPLNQSQGYSSDYNIAEIKGNNLRGANFNESQRPFTIINCKLYNYQTEKCFVRNCFVDGILYNLYSYNEPSKGQPVSFIATKVPAVLNTAYTKDCYYIKNLKLDSSNSIFYKNIGGIEYLSRDTTIKNIATDLPVKLKSGDNNINLSCISNLFLEFSLLINGNGIGTGGMPTFIKNESDMWFLTYNFYIKKDSSTESISIYLNPPEDTTFSRNLTVTAFQGVQGKFSNTFYDYSRAVNVRSLKGIFEVGDSYLDENNQFKKCIKAGTIGTITGTYNSNASTSQITVTTNTPIPDGTYLVFGDDSIRVINRISTNVYLCEGISANLTNATLELKVPEFV